MISMITAILLILTVIHSTESDHVLKDNVRRPKQLRQSLGSNIVNPYYAYNPDSMSGNAQLQQNNPVNNQQASCTCACGEMSYGPPVPCTDPQACVSYCLQMYPAQCTLVNTFGCCGSSCQYFQTQSLDRRSCTCNCAGQQYLDAGETCVSSQACLTKCLLKYPQVCTATTTQACCGRDCQSYSQAVATACSCRCQGNTFYPAPSCSNSEGCVSTCMTTYAECTATETQGCCGASCSSYVPTCRCSCGPDFSTTTSIPCQSGQTCLDTCIRSYGACTQENTQACCGTDCLHSFPSCSCMCGTSQYTTLSLSCGSSQQCVQACLQSVAQCNVMNTQACCGSDCSGYIPTCRCQCGSSTRYTASTCGSAEDCANTCIRQFGYACTPSNTVGCCNGTICTRQNRFIGVSRTSALRLSRMMMMVYTVISSLLATFL